MPLINRSGKTKTEQLDC